MRKITPDEKLRRMREALKQAKFQINYAMFEIDRIREEHTADTKRNQGIVQQMLEDLKDTRG